MSALQDAFSLLLLPFAASVVFVLIHAYLGVHVLRRNIIFADLALAQLSALGATVAFAAGHAAASLAGFGYGLLFTALGAALLTATRRLSRLISQEAFVGILYVAATAATVLVVDRSPQGAEHVKKILVGSILTVSAEELARFAALYLVIGALHFMARRPLLAISTEAEPAGRGTVAVMLWDFFFFLSFGVVVTSSVTTAGVLLVFSFLIVPALIGAMFSSNVGATLVIAWGVGIVASAIGLAASYALDLPTGAAMVTTFALMLVPAGLAKALWSGSPAQRQAKRAAAARLTAAAGLAAVLASSLWLIVNPGGDQPLLALVEQATGLDPGIFLSAADRETYESAGRDVVRFQSEFERLGESERAARHEGRLLSDDELRRLASYQRTFSEMAQGERFVRQVLLTKARGRERWIVGVPLALISGLGLVLIGARQSGYWRRRAG
jgi:zinc/manganese transport system permease protein